LLPPNLRERFVRNLKGPELEALAADFRAYVQNDFLAYCTEALAPFGQKPAPHHRLLCRELQAVADGKTRRLMVNLPPGSAKSTYGSKLFPGWYMARRPRANIIGASNTGTLAEQFSRAAMGLVRDNHDLLSIGLGRENVELWDVSNGSTYRAAGVGAAIAGQRADLALIDDPTRSRADAESETVRESQWAWFTSDLRTRLKPSAAIVVIMTRWHMDDLGGRLLERQPGLWRVVSIPAIAGEEDPLGREPGEWLWSDDPAYPYGAELQSVHAEFTAAGAMRDWAALYQQTPVAAEGALFKVGQIEVIDEAPTGTVWARGWDLAATKQTGTRNPDYTAGVKMGRAPSGRIVVGDVRRRQAGPEDVEALIVTTAADDGRIVRIGLPQDPGQAGKTQVLYLTRKLAGYRVDSSPESGDKATRAAPFASQVNVGNVALLRGDWNHAYRDELASFPNGMKDDQVDASSRAFSMIGQNAPMRIDPAALASFRRR
jgi:predicted phage terminase large subunit-like protein